MASGSTYKGAQLIAEAVEKHFAQQHAAARGRGEGDMAPLPTAKLLEQIIDVAFWASLRREEGNLPKISLALLPPDVASIPIIFEKRIPLTSGILTKLSLGVERPGVHLGVWHENDQLYVWGSTLRIPSLCFVLDVSEPGLLVIKHRRAYGYGKFANVAVLTGDDVKIIDEQNIHLPECPSLLKSLLGFTSSESGNDSVNVLIQLAVSMRAHKHGGTLLVVSSSSDRWRKSIIHPVKYSISPSYIGLSDILNRDELSQNQVALRTEIDTIAGLTAVDGATIINDKFELLAFGAKIAREDGKAIVEKINISEPIVGGEEEIVNPSHTGGTRHLSAAQFVFDQRDTLALVASQDGHFTIFTWSHREQIVQAYRIDSLLL